METAEVVVIGAGMAGLGAACRLAKKGHEVVVLEARDRIGGRVHTDTRWGFGVDLGASWIHGTTGNPIAKLARKYGVPGKPTNFTKQVLWEEGRRLGREEVEEAVRATGFVYQWVEELVERYWEDGDRTLAAAMGDDLVRRGGLDFIEDPRLLDWALNEFMLDEGASVGVLGMKGYDDGEPHEGPDVLLYEGYGGLVSRVADGLDIRTGCVVEHVEWSEDQVRVRTGRDEFVARAAVVTLPIGVLKRGDVSFSPQLPEPIRRGIEHIGMGDLEKVVVRFEEDFWPRAAHFLGKITEPHRAGASILSWMPFSGQPVLMGFVTASGAEELVERTDEEVVRAFMADLRVYFEGAPQPVGAIVTRWREDPFARGAYSYLPVGSRGKDRVSLREPAGRMFFAGEGTSVDNPATVHGAWIEGRRAAKAVRRVLRGGKKKRRV
ncbi:MAG: FAD-dependent oxidoreductase [Myxococcota bacterium]